MSNGTFEHLRRLSADIVSERGAVGEQSCPRIKDEPHAPLTVERINERVQKIGEVGEWDDEAGHGAEDALYVDTLQAIAGGSANPAELAKAALATQEIDFARWCS